MSKIAHRFARLVWYGCLWLMRRPWMKRLQRSSRRLFPPALQGRAQESLLRQNRFARRFGLRILTVLFTFMLGYMALVVAYVGVIALYESGFFNLPRELAGRTGR
ncbi:MAG: hypothetical protein HYR64_00985 [Fimbriimonas ginsengisoli]|uniref:Uncharacterized protein n=1 Tax=Fimbriimonas ginsengisoli TaxID=1005039 RepID=A0A931LYT2_FIMGI|nr:hypothetical protein [Fimbriimonas ginsengisoli]